ncbi:MAG: hypothetical protein K0S27_599 [Gammaproteobacteria bacterium]|jgi:hypothetical protein|nr:hypothetical protein [Gammaproteobacteria bacterium]
MSAQPLVLIKAIPHQIVNEGAALGPLNLSDFIQSSETDGSDIRFVAELSDGRALTKGLICTSYGTFGGIPSVGTQGAYEVVILAKNASGAQLTTKFSLTIKERISMMEGDQYFTHLKSRVWEALEQDLPLPDMSQLGDRPLTLVEIYYLMERFATLTIWDVNNLETVGNKIALQLADCSPHFQVYDRGSCLVGAPKDLFSHARTLEDALQTAKAMIREVYKRGWAVELTGFNKMVRAAWVEAQILIHKYGNPLEILHYEPTEADTKLYQAQEKAQPGAAKGM